LFPKVIGSSWEARFLVNTYAVYFWVDLVDGDKILSLFALFIREQLDIVNNNGGQANKSLSARLGIVQTTYANGASTQFLKSLGLEVVFTPTGVKYLHKRALEYDIGIYFEANGHGTVVFSEDFISQLESLSNELSSCSTQNHIFVIYICDEMTSNYEFIPL
jgi:phosphomannomutase